MDIFFRYRYQKYHVFFRYHLDTKHIVNIVYIYIYYMYLGIIFFNMHIFVFRYIYIYVYIYIYKFKYTYYFYFNQIISIEYIVYFHSIHIFYIVLDMKLEDESSPSIFFDDP